MLVFTFVVCCDARDVILTPNLNKKKLCRVSSFNMSSIGKSADVANSFGTVVKCGYLKKLKTSKKKYFVLRAEMFDTSACLEYYDSEKKFNSGQPPKRTIPLKTCFNINKRSDTKHKHVIALYTKDDCFCVILDTEESLDSWLKVLLAQQQGEEATDGQTPSPTFEHVWQVQVLQRGLGATPLWGIVSGQSNSFRLCLTDRTLSLIRIDNEKAQIELELSSVRSCGYLEKYFYLEAGRCSSIGVGELWMETEDANIARNIHQTVCNAMSSNKASREDIRPRANSDTDYAKNYPMKRREPTTPSILPPLQQDISCTESECGRTHSTPQGHVAPVAATAAVGAAGAPATLVPSCPCSGCSRSATNHSAGPDSTSSDAITASTLTWTADSRTSSADTSSTNTNDGDFMSAMHLAISHQRTRSLPLSNAAPFTVDNQHLMTTTTMAAHHHCRQQQQLHNLINMSHHHPRAAKRPNSSKCATSVSDSRASELLLVQQQQQQHQQQQQQPFRQRTTSEGAPPAGNRYNRFAHHHHHHHVFPTYITASSFDRPQSCYVPPQLPPVEVSPRSPPSGSPVSPPSADCSTDSAESSISIDDRDSWLDSEQTIHYPIHHSLTPSDEAIPEENCDDGVDSPCSNMQHTCVSGGGLVPGDYMDMQPASSDDGCYVDSPRGGRSVGKMPNMSPATSNCSITSGTPSMDYPLEKVPSFLAQSEEDETSSTDRPTRTYSVGSRPATLKYQGHIDPTSASDSRKRAFSVGSKTKKVLRNRLFPHHGASTAHPNMKSSSAPILSTRNLEHQKDFLMELDFTRQPPNINNNNSGYVAKKPPGSNKQVSNTATTTNEYVIMKPGHVESIAKMNKSRDDNNSYMDMKPGTSPAKPVYMQSDSRHGSINSRSSKTSGSTEYMEMAQPYSQPSTSPVVNSSPLPQYMQNKTNLITDYIVMSFCSAKSNKDRNSFSSNASTDQYSASPVKNSVSPMGSPQTDYVSMDYSHSRSGSDSKPNHQQEGYVEMTLGKGSQHKRQSSADSGRIPYADYAKMSPVGGTGKERKNSGKRDKNRSAPIMIQNSAVNQNQMSTNDPSPGSPMLTGYPPIRKYSIGTPPNAMHLPLSAGSSVTSTSYTSLPRQQSRSRKNSSRRESRDSSNSSVTTPSSSSTIFPISLNSPISPIKSSVIKVPPAVLKAKYDVSSSAFRGNNRDDYTFMDFDRSSSFNNAMTGTTATVVTTAPIIVTQGSNTRLSSTSSIINSTIMSAEDNSDYVNYNPAQNIQCQCVVLDNTSRHDETGDYAIMKPGVLSRLISDTGTSSPLVPDTNCCFRPIIDEVLLKSDAATATTTTISTSTDDISLSSQRSQSYVSFTCGRPSSETRSVLSSASSRPSSTSSELSSSASTLVGGYSRPASVNSDQMVTPATLHYAKLDLSSDVSQATATAPGTVDVSDSSSSPRSLKCSEGVITGSSDTSQPTFTYAKIDFVKRESFTTQQQGATGSAGQAGAAQSQQCSTKLKH